MNSRLDELHLYPFERLDVLKASLSGPVDKAHIALSIGEPKHAAPPFVVEFLARQDTITRGLAAYPPTRGSHALREAAARWASQRYGLAAQSLDPDRNVLPVNGTREALFSFAQAVVERSAQALVMLPNPFYQIYEGAAILAGARPHYVDAHGGREVFEAIAPEVWRNCQLLYICTPNNPTGGVQALEDLTYLVELADEFDFVIASDECYSEIYFDEAAPPPGILQACTSMNRHDYRRCVVFQSLSKRSNLPGLRSGFVAGDADLLERYYLYRTYHGCAMPEHSQAASALAWNDEAHVVANRVLYREKFERVLPMLDNLLDVEMPQAAFYLWPRTPIADTDFAARLFEQEHITVLPGSFLARESDGHNPGLGHVRMALVATLAECEEAAARIARFLGSL
ncbi:MAG: succinyldiaminopimelate transaminase [Pseudomonadales bacterium]